MLVGAGGTFERAVRAQPAAAGAETVVMAHADLAITDFTGAMARVAATGLAPAPSAAPAEGR